MHLLRFKRNKVNVSFKRVVRKRLFTAKMTVHAKSQLKDFQFNPSKYIP